MIIGLEPSQESVWLPEMTITDGVPATSQEQRLEMSPFLPAELSQNSNRFEGDLRQPPPMPPHHGEFRDQCGPWQPWDNVTCWWPSTSWEQLPQSCKFLPIPEQLPPVLKSVRTSFRNTFNKKICHNLRNIFKKIQKCPRNCHILLS